MRDSGFSETWYPDREVPSYRREDSVESLDSVESHTLSAASDCTLIAGSEGTSPNKFFFFFLFLMLVRLAPFDHMLFPM